MDASERVSWADCPDCGGLAAVGWRNGDPVAVDCAGGCQPRVEDVQISAASRVSAGVLDGDVEQMASILEEAVLQTTEAALVADAWADILGEEGRSPRRRLWSTARDGSCRR